MISTIWDDINCCMPAIFITDPNYKLSSLTDVLYIIEDNPQKKQRMIKHSGVTRLFKDLNKIKIHSGLLAKDENITALIHTLFKYEEIKTITPLDRVFLNSYFRRLLRAKLEENLSNSELVAGLVITCYENHEIDRAIVETLRVLRIICRYLGIESTTHDICFDISKLDHTCFWSSVSAKFIILYGEDRIAFVDPDMPFNRSIIITLLNTIFDLWSGSSVQINGDKVKVIPATYVTRMLPKLKI